MVINSVKGFLNKAERENELQMRKCIFGLVHSKDSDQPAHSCNFIRIFAGCILDIAKGAKFLHVDDEDSSDC